MFIHNAPMRLKPLLPLEWALTVLMFDISYTGMYQQMLKCIQKRVEGEAEMDFCHMLQFCAVLQTYTGATLHNT